MGSSCLCNCNKKSPLPHEELVREIVLSLKITNMSYRALKKTLTMLSSGRTKFNKEFILENFSGFFYEKDKIANERFYYHSKIYEFFISYLDKETTIFQVLLLVFPLLSKTKNAAFDFADILVNLSDSGLTKDNLYHAFITIYEFYSFKLNQVLKLICEKDEVKKSLTAANFFVFKYENIDKAVLRTINRFELKNDFEDPEEIKKRFSNRFDSDKIFFFNDIRDGLIKIYDQKS